MKPSHFYFDDLILEKEQVLFKQTRYLGHELSVDNYLVIDQDDEARVLIKNKNGVECLSNVCRHRQGTILTGSGKTNNVVCSLHGWTYDREGKLLGAPQFDPCPNLSLRKFSTQTWNGLIFDSGFTNIKENLADMNLSKHFSFENYAFHSRIVQECNYNWKTFIEVYLDDYHVKPSHPGLGSFVNCEELNWQFSKNYSCQSVGVNNELRTPGTPVWERYQKAVLNYSGGKVPEYGAIWLTIYPNIMVEWYPHVLVVSTVWPDSPQKTKNIVEFYYPEDVLHFEPELVAAHQAAYMETTVEDDEIALRIDKGRKFNYKTGMDDFGPVQDPLEKGYQHFYDYYDKYVSSNWSDGK